METTQNLTLKKAPQFEQFTPQAQLRPWARHRNTMRKRQPPRHPQDRPWRPQNPTRAPQRSRSQSYHSPQAMIRAYRATPQARTLVPNRGRAGPMYDLLRPKHIVQQQRLLAQRRRMIQKKTTQKIHRLRQRIDPRYRNKPKIVLQSKTTKRYYIPKLGRKQTPVPPKPTLSVPTFSLQDLTKEMNSPQNLVKLAKKIAPIEEKKEEEEEDEEVVIPERKFPQEEEKKETVEWVEEEPAKKKEPPMPLVSVIVPMYNVQKYVQKAIQSLLDQTRPMLMEIYVPTLRGF